MRFLLSSFFTKRPRQHPSERTRAVGAHAVVLVVAVITSVGSTAAEAQQQNSDRQRPDVLQGMLRSLIDIQDRARPTPESQSPRNNRAVSPQIREVRANLAGFAQEISNLVATLHGDVQRTDGIRSLFGDALKVNAAATLLARQSATETSLNRISNDFQTLDRDWRLLSFRLQQIRDLGRQAQRDLQRVERFNNRLGELLKISPQIDRAELTREAAELSAGILSLLDEIDLEIDDATQRYNLLLEGRRVYEQSRRVAYLASRNESYDTIRNEYQEFQKLWAPLVTKIRPLQRRYIDRQLRRVQNVERQIQELLWLPPKIDRSELVYLTNMMRRDVDAFLEGITLRQLMQVPSDRGNPIASADSFYSACGDFAECVTTGENEEDLAELYFYLEGEWNRLATIMKDLPSSDVRQRFREIDRTIREMREILRVRQPLDHQRAIQVAAALENLAAHYEGDVRSILSQNRDRYSDRFRSQCIRASRAFYDSTNALHSELVQNAALGQLRNRSNELKRNWDTLQQYAERLPPADRDHLLRVTRRITPQVVDMQALLSL